MTPASSIVTGAAGFIGSHLSAALLHRGDAVVGVDNFDPFYDRTAKVANIAPLKCNEFELVEADIRDGEAMCRVFDRVRPISVFHIAALAGVRPSIQEPARVVAVNVEGLVNVLEAARRCGCRRFVFASSSSVYGNPEREDRSRKQIRSINLSAPTPLPSEPANCSAIRIAGCTRW